MGTDRERGAPIEPFAPGLAALLRVIAETSLATSRSPKGASNGD